MTVCTGKTALVTGANSGIGFEASAQLADAGFRCVMLACRTLEKANRARFSLVERCGKDVFQVLSTDLAELEPVIAAGNDLAKRPGNIDFLLLNAAMSPGLQLVCNSGGVELTFASSLIGHHLLTMHLLANQKLSPQARIVIAGSEAALGNMFGMKIPDFTAMANQHLNGNLEATLKAVACVQPPYKYHWLNSYGAAKLYVVWWAAALSRRLAPGQTANVVSPGTTPNTNFNRHQPWLMRTVAKTVAALIARHVGMAGPVQAAARRYLDAEGFSDELTGQFLASPPGKLVGPLEVQKKPCFFDTASQEACWNVVVSLAGGADYLTKAGIKKGRT